MGKRIHVATKYVVEYKELPFLNYKAVEFCNLLNELECYNSVFEQNSGETILVETPKDEFNKAYEKLTNFGALEQEQRDDIIDALNACGLNVSDAVELFKMCLDNGESNDNWYHFAFY